MKIEIKSRYSGEVLFAHEQENNTIRITLELAVKAGAKLTGAKLSNSNLFNAKLTGADLSNANLFNAKLTGADLFNANLSYADLSNSNLSNANLSYADLSNAKLTGADLFNANLSNADLSNAKLTGASLLCIGDMKNIFTMQLDFWKIGFTKDTLQIGCQRHLIKKWKKFDDEIIDKMDDKALEWWNKWKDHIFKTIELCNEP
jgi:hypothetical protein